MIFAEKKNLIDLMDGLEEYLEKKNSEEDTIINTDEIMQ